MAKDRYNNQIEEQRHLTLSLETRLFGFNLLNLPVFPQRIHPRQFLEHVGIIIIDGHLHQQITKVSRDDVSACIRLVAYDMYHVVPVESGFLLR